MKTAAPTYLVTLTFIGGNLEGLTITEKTSVEYEIGFICKRPYGGTSPYRIDNVVKLTDE